MKTLKHLFTVLLLLCATAVAAHDFVVGGIYYNITDATNKTVAVSYRGSYSDSYSNEYTGNVEIPESVAYNGKTYSVTSIGKDAFRDCSGLTSVVIGNSVTSIGNSAFRGCTGLTSIIIPNSLASIGDYAFYDCSGLDSVVIPNSVTSIGYSAFDGCIGLVSVEIGNGITNFGNYAFAYCSSLVNITSRIPANSIFAVNTKVFDGVDKTASTLYVPYGAKETYASTAGWSEFANIVELEPEIITGGSCGKNVTWTLVDDVLTISGSGAMDDFFNISAPWEEYRDGIHTVIIEEGVTSIGFAAFHDYSGLTSVIIGNSVTSIGGQAFYDCIGLTSIVIGNSVTSIGGQAFDNCTGLTSVVIPNSVTSIGGAAFRACSGLTSIEIPSSVTSIGDEAFHACPGLTSVTIGNSVTSIGNYAFRACSGLTSIEIPNSVTIIEPKVFAYCAGLTRIKVESGNTKYDSREDCNAIIETATNTLIVGCKTTKIPAGVTSIGEDAFSECNSLTSIEIPNSVTSIGDAAFYDCYSLTSIEIPNSVTSIGNFAFQRCFGLTSVTIGNSVTSIGSRAFSACSGLASITSLIPADKLFTVGTSVFDHVDKTYSTLYVPYGAKEAYASTAGWSEFANIVELEPTATEVIIVINQYGCATYCSPYALDFSNVEGIKAYSAIGYKPSTQVVTLARVMTTGAGQGVFIKGEPGEYTVPVIDNFDEYTLNMLVGTLKQTTVNSTDGAMSNYKFTVAELDEVPMFYPFEDNTAFSAGKAYLQIPTAWLPATAQKSVSVRFDEGETTDIEELKGENGEVKTIYDLQGRVVENPASGIYIIDGKKVIIK